MLIFASSNNGVNLIIIFEVEGRLGIDNVPLARSPNAMVVVRLVSSTLLTAALAGLFGAHGAGRVRYALAGYLTHPMRGPAVRGPHTITTYPSGRPKLVPSLTLWAPLRLIS